MPDKTYEVPAAWKKRAYIDDAKYKEMYRRWLAEPDAFWANRPSASTGRSNFSKVKNTSFAKPNVSIKWFEDGSTNVAYNCIDRHLHARGHQTAIIWEGDDPKESKHITYRELHRRGCLSPIFAQPRVKKGDRVTMDMPMNPEAAIAMLACARIGAIDSVIFGGHSPEWLASHVEDRKSDLVITADRGPARRPEDRPQGRYRRGERQMRRRRLCRHVRGTGATVKMIRSVTRGTTRLRKPYRRIARRRDERGRSAVHPLHLGLDRQTKGVSTPPPAIWSASMTHQ